LFGSANLISTFTANNVLRVHKMLRKQILGLFLVSIAWFVLAGSFLSYTYKQTTIETMPGVVLDGVQINQPVYNEAITTPYKEYTLPLIMFSVALFIAGFALYFLRFPN
jgi:Sec-independent protein secretion pathway component TatC